MGGVGGWVGWGGVGWGVVFPFFFSHRFSPDGTMAVLNEAVVDRWVLLLTSLDKAAERRGESFVRPVAVWLETKGLEEPGELRGIVIDNLDKTMINDIQLGFVRRVQSCLEAQQKSTAVAAPALNVNELATALETNRKDRVMLTVF